MKKKKIIIPYYSLGEILTNSISHGLGTIFGIVALIIVIIISVQKKNTIAIVSGIIYGVTMIIMYFTSCLYHALSSKRKAKKVLRVIDHCDIFVFIAGCYTPISLVLIGEEKGWLIFSIIWIIAILGVVFNAIDLEKYQKPSTILYLLMGWFILLSYQTLKQVMHPTGIQLLIGGGIAYTIGALSYAIGTKVKYMHSIFHFLVLIGSILHFFCICLYVL